MPMTLGEYIKKSGRNPYEKDGKIHAENEEGYLVKYKDGYESWSPAIPFEESYKPADTPLERMLIEGEDLTVKLEKLPFSMAISLLKNGYAIRRTGWNGKGLFVIKQVPTHIESEVIPKMQSLPQSAKDLILKGKGFIDYTSQCLIYNENTGRADSWVPSISDVFAEDWEVIE